MTTLNEETNSLAADYPKALRAIGSALDELGVEAFEVTSVGANYFVRIESQTAKKPRTKNIVDSTVRQILQRILPHRYAADGVSVGPELMYTARDIERLDRDGQLRRRGAGKPDPHSLPQALRAIGSYLELKKARLLRLSKSGTSITVRYETALDGRTTEEFTPSSLYALFVRRYVKRSDR